MITPATTEDQDASSIQAAKAPILSHGPARMWSYGDLDRHRAEVKLGRAQRARLLRAEGVLTLKLDVKVGEAKLAQLRRPESVQSIKAENVRGKLVWRTASPITSAGAAVATAAALSPVVKEVDTVYQ